MTARSLISPRFVAVSWPRVDFLSSKRAVFNYAQLAMVMGYVVLMCFPFDGDAMMFGLVCEAAALWLYVMSRTASKPPPSA